MKQAEAKRVAIAAPRTPQVDFANFEGLASAASAHCMFNAMRACAMEFTLDAIGRAEPGVRDVLRDAARAAGGDLEGEQIAVSRCREVETGSDAASRCAAIVTRVTLSASGDFGWGADGEPYFPMSAVQEALIGATKAAAHADVRDGVADDLDDAMHQHYLLLLRRAEEILRTPKRTDRAAQEIDSATR